MAMVGLDWVGPNVFVDGEIFLSILMGKGPKYCGGTLRFKYVQERRIAPIFGQTTPKADNWDRFVHFPIFVSLVRIVNIV